MLPRRLEDGLAAKRGRIGRNRRRGAVSIVAIAAIATGVLFAAPGASAAKPGSTLTTFDTPGTYTWTVPHGVKQATIDLFGAQGGSDGVQLGSPGGKGGEATATLNVNAGQVFEIAVGGTGGSFPGAGGVNGGGTGGTSGGGGATDVRAGSCAATMTCDLSGRILVAGGGGGGTAVGCVGGGGGGSGFIAPFAVFGTMQAGVQSGDGSVVISKG